MCDIKKDSVFNELNAVNVNGHTETKQTGGANLTYLSWAWAWAEVAKRFPTANYAVLKNADGDHFFASKYGIEVRTTVTINDVTREMWLPVMDGANRALADEPYEVKGYNGVKVIPRATMTDINKAIMRCLTKNLAMFGLGLYIYAGEDLPEEEVAEQPVTSPAPVVKPATKSGKPATKSSPLGKQASDAFRAHPAIKAVTDAERNAAWKKLLTDTVGKFNSADITDLEWGKLLAAIDVVKSI